MEALFLCLALLSYRFTAARCICTFVLEYFRMRLLWRILSMTRLRKSSMMHEIIS
jgi:hypothetical protein